MKIGLLVPGFSADADDWCIPALRHLVQRLATTEDVRVIALRYPYRAGCYQVDGARVVALGGGQRGGWGSLGLWRCFWATLLAEHRRCPFDVLHAFWANETGALTALAGRLLSIPTLVSLAGGELVALRDIAYGGQLAWTERLKVRLALRLADVVTAGSHTLLGRAAPWLSARSAGRVQRVPLGVDLDLFRPDRTALDPSGPPRLVQAASLLPVKDQATLLRAAALLRQGGSAFELEIAGEGPLKSELRVWIDRLGLVDVVCLRGEIPHHHLPQFYNQGAIFVLSSRYESQNMAALEAAACGLPVVGTHVGVLPELVPEAGIVVPVGDSTALAEALNQLVGDPARRSAMGQAARKRVEDEFGLDACVERFRQLYATIAR